MDNQQQPTNNLDRLSTSARVVHIPTTLSKVYPQSCTTWPANLQHALKGLSTEKQAFNYDYYFLKV